MAKSNRSAFTVGAAIAEMLGVDPDNVLKIVLTFDSASRGIATADVTMIVKADTGWVEQLKRYELREPDPSENGVTAKRQREEAAVHG